LCLGVFAAKYFVSFPSPGHEDTKEKYLKDFPKTAGIGLLII